MKRKLFATLLITATVWAQNRNPQGTGPFSALMEQDPGLRAVPGSEVARLEEKHEVEGENL